MSENRTPSMDDKDIPSPPERTNEQYEIDKARGINALPHWTEPIEAEYELGQKKKTVEVFKEEEPTFTMKEFIGMLKMYAKKILSKGEEELKVLDMSAHLAETKKWQDAKVEATKKVDGANVLLQVLEDLE